MEAGKPKKRCTICSQICDMENFVSRYTGDIIRVCKECCLIGTEGQTERKKMLYAHLWITSDGSKITDPWEVVDAGKTHKCSSCKKVKESSI